MPYPLFALTICTDEAIDKLVAGGKPDLLGAVFNPFKQELGFCDPSYAARMGQSMLTLENFSNTYFEERQDAEPLVRAAFDLAEAMKNLANEYTVPWRTRSCACMKSSRPWFRRWTATTSSDFTSIS